MPSTNNKQSARRQATTKFDKVLACLHPKIFVAIHEAGKFKGMGLRGQRLGPGRYKFVRSDGKPMDSYRASLVVISEPWASERTMVAVLACAKHGLSCPEMDLMSTETRSCERQHVLVEGARWMATVFLLDRESVIVKILRYPKAKTVAGAMRLSTFQDADFTIQVILGD
jgi:hypothetical protein